MDNLIGLMKSYEDYIGGKGASDPDIKNAEESLNTNFSNDYKEYLLTIGLAMFNGHELTGITNDKRLSVIEVTKEQRSINTMVGSNWYVVEELYIDGSVIWQDPKGKIYQTFGKQDPELVANSLIEYLK